MKRFRKGRKEALLPKQEGADRDAPIVQGKGQ
jgi:hypothetical protein